MPLDQDLVNTWLTADARPRLKTCACVHREPVCAAIRPLNSVLLFSRLMGEHFADTPYGEQYADREARA